MSWIRGQATDYIDLSNEVVAAVTGISADSVDSVAAGGSGYAAGDLITLTGGTSTIDTVLEVTSVSGGAVTGARIYNAGVYSSAPSDPVSQGSTDGSGTGATFNMTYSANGWTADRDTTWSGSEREVIMHGSGGGADSIYVGWRTYQNAGAGRYNWELHGFTGFDSGVGHLSQAGVSPGDHESSTDGCFLTLFNSTMDYFISVTPYRVILTVQVGSNYFHAYLGYLNRFATSTEFPYPLVVAGSNGQYDATHDQAEAMSTLTDPISPSRDYSPMWLLDQAGTWRPIVNATVSGTSLNNASTENFTFPCGSCAAASDTNNTPEADRFYNTFGQGDFDEFITKNGSGSPDGNLEATPGTGDDYRVLWPTLLARSKSSAGGTEQKIWGELDDVFWFGGFGGGLANEDRIIQGGEVYRVFQNCNRSQVWTYLAIKEA